MIIIIMCLYVGNANAQIRLGFLYQHGNGVEKNELEAVRLYRLAAKSGDLGQWLWYDNNSHGDDDDYDDDSIDRYIDWYDDVTVSKSFIAISFHMFTTSPIYPSLPHALI